MARGQLTGVIRQLRRLALRDEAGVTDGQLLDAFVQRQDEAALAALVRRHGPMVWGVCRRLLRSLHDAEDAFQATFLVLVRKAAAVRDREAVANWLYGVARQTAVRLRSAAARRRGRERLVADLPEPPARDADPWHDLRALLDRELSRLPDKYRVLIVLCDLEGRTRKEVARQLGCPEGTVGGRLARARGLLADRLARLGLPASAGALAAALAQGAASAGGPGRAVSDTVRAATLLAGGPAAAGAISARVTALTERVVRAMLLNQFKAAAAVLLAVVLVAALAGVATLPVLGGQPPRPAQAERPAAPGADVAAEPPPNLRDYSAMVAGLAFTADGRRLVTAGYQGGKSDPRVWDAVSGREVHKLSAPGHQPMSVAVSPDNKLAATGGFEGRIWVWDLRTGKPVFALNGHAVADGEGKDLQVTGLAFAPDGKELASAGYDGSVRFWSVEKREETGRAPDHPRVGAFDPSEFWVFGVAYSPDGKYVARAASSDSLRQWERATLNELPAIAPKGWNQAWQVKYSPDGKLLLAATNDTKVRLWDAATGKEVRVLTGHRRSIFSIAVTADGKLLATGDGGGTVKLWEVGTGQELATWTRHQDIVRCLAFSPDGKVLISAGGHDTEEPVRRWDVVGRKELP